jgi:hypothetical protein
MKNPSRQTGNGRSQSPKKCPKHGISYALRQNAKTGEVAIACPFCDVEAHGGTKQDIMAVAKRIADSARE